MNIVIIAAILPALILIYYIWRRDKYNREPISELIKGFIYGILTTPFAAAIEEALQLSSIVPSAPQTWLESIWLAFGGVAIVEESVKLLALWLLLRKNKYFDEMTDGIVYAVCVGMGFAAAENIGYLMSNLDNWQSIAFGRAIFSIPGHYMFAVAMGYYYSICHFTYAPAKYKRRVLLVPVLLHGIFDSLLMMADVTPELSGIIWFVFVCFCLYMPHMARRSINRMLEEDSKSNNSIIIWK